MKIKLNDKDRGKFFKCLTCERLVGSLKIELCAGHKQQEAYYVSLWEWLLIKLKVLQ